MLAEKHGRSEKPRRDFDWARSAGSVTIEILARLELIVRRFILIFLCSTFASCTTARFLLQAAHGHLDIVTRARLIDTLVRDGVAPPKLRALLEEVEPIKEYGSARGLSVSGSYRFFAELDRSAAVWVVTASKPLAFVPMVWSFPIVGSAPYLGWFSYADAVDFADSLATEGWDVDVRPAAAYSTLGWFDDPLLSTMITHGPGATGDLVNIVLHESVHATVYVPSQTVLNESIASYIADRMTLEYLGGRYGHSSLTMRAYLAADAKWRHKLDRMAAAYEALETLYESTLADTDKLARKATFLARLAIDIDARRSLTNATLIGFRSYRSGKAELDTLFEACGGDWTRFLAVVGTLVDSDHGFSKDHQEDLRAVLQPLIARGCTD